MRHLVLGSEGQIGKYVCDEVERNGDEVIRWDIKLGDEYDLAYPTEEAEEKLDAAVFGADFVHFLAFNVGGSTYLQKRQNSFSYIDENISIMQRVFGYLGRAKVPFYFASSQMANMTDSVYGQLKAVGESYTRALGGINLRFWNVYGYESDPEKTHVITDFIKMALRDGKILCRTTGEENRHFTYAPLAAEYIYRVSQDYDNIKALKKDWYPLGDINGQEVDIKWIAEAIASLTGDVPCYFTTKKDKTQTIYNKFPSAFDFQRVIGMGGVNGTYDSEYWKKFRNNLSEMVERIKADG